MNKIVLMGRLVQDIELEDYETKNGDIAYCNFTLAVNRSYRNAEGEYVVDFIDCCCFGGGCKVLESFATKGARILVVGSLQQNIWIDENENKHVKYKVNVDNINIIDFPKKEEKVEEDKPMKSTKKYKK